jgi:hypothetical protein
MRENSKKNPHVSHDQLIHAMFASHHLISSHLIDMNDLKRCFNLQSYKHVYLCRNLIGHSVGERMTRSVNGVTLSGWVVRLLDMEFKEIDDQIPFQISWLVTESVSVETKRSNLENKA